MLHAPVNEARADGQGRCEARPALDHEQHPLARNSASAILHSAGGGPLADPHVRPGGGAVATALPNRGNQGMLRARSGGTESPPLQPSRAPFDRLQQASGRSGGNPLTAALRTHFESRFSAEVGGQWGCDVDGTARFGKSIATPPSRSQHSLSSVRIHGDANAARLVRAHRANALTIGEHIYFGKDRYDPENDKGSHLLAHEIVHVLQQRRPQSSGSSSASEAEARSLADLTQSTATLPAIRHHARATDSAPLCEKSKAREVIEDELDSWLFVNIKNAWPLIRTASQAEREEIRNDKSLERNIRRRESEMNVLKTYLLLAYQSEENFPDNYKTFINATDRWGTDEEAIYAMLRGATEADRKQMQELPGFVEVIEDEMSGDELQLALGLLYAGQQPAGGDPSKQQSATKPAKKSRARQVIESELDSIFSVSIDNAWPHIRTAPQAERDEIRNDKVLERNIRRQVSAMDLLKTYLLLTYQSEDKFPAHYAAFIEATDKWGTDEARIFAILRGISQAERQEVQQMPGFVETIEDEMSGSDLQLALRLLYEGELRASSATSTARTSTHLEIGKRYALDVGARGGFDEAQDKLEQAFAFGGEKSGVILDDSSLWAQFADKYAVEEVWYLRMIARYRRKSEFPVADTQSEPFVGIIWEAVKGWGTDEDKLIKGLQDVNAASSFKKGGGGRSLKNPPREEVKDDSWFVPMLEAELSGDDLERAINAVSASATKASGARDTLQGAIDHRDMKKIRELLGDVALMPSDRGTLRNDPVILAEMGDDLKGVELCETTQLLQYGAAGIPTLVRDLLEFFRKDPIDVAGATGYLKKLIAADQSRLIEEPGVYFMLTDSKLPDDQQAKLLAAIRSLDPRWQEPGSEGVYQTYYESVSTTLPVSFTASEARIDVRMNIDTSSVPKDDGKPYKIKSGDLEDWTRAIDEAWNDKYRIVSVNKRLALVFDPYIAVGITPPNVTIIVAPGNGRASAAYPTMRLFLEDLKPKTVAHEFGHLLGNPDEYALTASEYQRISGTRGKAPAKGETVEGLMGSQWESTKIAERHVEPALEIVNKVRDTTAYPVPFALEKV